MYVIAMVKNMVIRLVLGLDSKQLAAEQDSSVTSVLELEVAELICTMYVTFRDGPLIILLIWIWPLKMK